MLQYVPVEEMVEKKVVGRIGSTELPGGRPIVRIVTVLEIVSLSIFKLPEYGLA